MPRGRRRRKASCGTSSIASRSIARPSAVATASISLPSASPGSRSLRPAAGPPEKGRLRYRLGVEGRIDYILLANRLAYERKLLARERRLVGNGVAAQVQGRPSGGPRRRRGLRMESIDPARAAADLTALVTAMDDTRRAVEAAWAAARAAPLGADRYERLATCRPGRQARCWRSGRRRGSTR